MSLFPVHLFSTRTLRDVELIQGETITLFPSVNRTAVVGAVGTTVTISGERLVYTWILDVTLCDDDVDDTLDVFIDTLFGTATWINIAHFTQVLGNGAATARFCVTVPANMLTTDLVATDCAVGVARGVVGSAFRGRYTIVDGGGADADFTFSLTGYAL